MLEPDSKKKVKKLAAELEVERKVLSEEIEYFNKQCAEIEDKIKSMSATHCKRKD